MVPRELSLAPLSLFDLKEQEFFIFTGGYGDELLEKIRLTVACQNTNLGGIFLAFICRG
nr:hypothetical protein [Sporomusa silvacetica]